jgi:hypothetical protein
MGRLLETLSRNGRHTAEPDAAPPGEEIPFIEVGGPRPAATAVSAPATVKFPVPPPPRPAPAPATPGVLGIVYQPLPAAGTVDQGPAAEVIAYHQPDHPVSRQYIDMFSELEASAGGESGRVVAFAGLTPGAGTTSVVLNLAATAARRGRRVLLVDADTARPAAAARLGLPEGPGLREVLARTLPLAWAAVPTAIEGLWAVTPGRRGGEPDVRTLSRVAAAIREQFDWTFLDLGASPPVLAAATDAAYAVLRQDDLESPQLIELREAVEAAGGALRGCVLTQG